MLIKIQKEQEESIPMKQILDERTHDAPSADQETNNNKKIIKHMHPFQPRIKAKLTKKQTNTQNFPTSSSSTMTTMNQSNN